MSLRKQLKKLLGEKYVFERMIPPREVKKLLEQNRDDFSLLLVQSLTAGCVKIDVCAYTLNGKVSLGYDVLVKDNPDLPEWICFDSPNDPCSLNEEDMLAVLDRVVQENNLSYTDCGFTRLDGKTVKVKKSKPPMD